MEIGRFGKKAGQSSLVQRWVKFEYFYSWIDKGFFLQNPIRDLLGEAEMP